MAALQHMVRRQRMGNMPQAGMAAPWDHTRITNALPAHSVRMIAVEPHGRLAAIARHSGEQDAAAAALGDLPLISLSSTPRRALAVAHSIHNGPAIWSGPASCASSGPSCAISLEGARQPDPNRRVRNACGIVSRSRRSIKNEPVNVLDDRSLRLVPGGVRAQRDHAALELG